MCATAFATDGVSLRKGLPRSHRLSFITNRPKMLRAKKDLFTAEEVKARPRQAPKSKESARNSPDLEFRNHRFQSALNRSSFVKWTHLPISKLSHMSLMRTVSIRFQYKIMAVRHAGLRIVGTLSTRRSGTPAVNARMFAGFQSARRRRCDRDLRSP
jgi:hypothetical protein